MPFVSNKPFTFDRVTRLALNAAIMIALFLTVRYLSSVILPFALGWLIAYLLEPLVTFIQNKLKFKSRGFSIATAFILVFAIIAALIMAFTPIISNEYLILKDLLKVYANNENLNKTISPFIPAGLEEYIKTVFASENLSLISDKIDWSAIMNRLNNLIINIFSGSYGVISGIITGLMALVYAFFVLLDYNKIVGSWHSILPTTIRETSVNFVLEMEKSMNTYFRAQALISLIMTILFVIGFWITGVPLALVLGIIFGILTFIPYMQLLGFIPAAMFCLIDSFSSNVSFAYLMGMVVLVSIIVQIIQDILLTPKIMGDATGLNPAILLLSLSTWGKLLGFLGLIIAIPFTTVLISYYKKFLERLKAGN